MLFICHPVKKIQLSIACWVAFENLVHSSTFKPRREVAVKDFCSHEVIFVHCDILCRNIGTSPAALVFALYYIKCIWSMYSYCLFFINWSADAEQIPGWYELFLSHLLQCRFFTPLRNWSMLFGFPLKWMGSCLRFFLRLAYFPGNWEKTAMSHR